MQALVAAALLQGEGEVLRHAFHAPGAEALAARLFDRIEDGAPDIARRAAAGMGAGVVVAQLERQGIGLAAALGDGLAVEVARWLRELDAAGRRPWFLNAEGDLQRAAARHGAQRAGRDAPERLGRARIAAQGRAAAWAATDSGSSEAKQRW